MTALGRPHLISQVLPSPFSICERGAKLWPDEGTAITVALATFNCFASVKMALFLYFFVPHLSRSLALIHSIPFLPITANPPARTTIMRFHLQHGPHFPLAEGTVQHPRWSNVLLQMVLLLYNIFKKLQEHELYFKQLKLTSYFILFYLFLYLIFGFVLLYCILFYNFI